jgi:hypothetical protein
MLFASILFVLQARAPIFAQEAGQQKPAAPLWQPLSEGVWKTDLGDERPEVVIVKMSNDEFDKLRQSSLLEEKTDRYRVYRCRIRQKWPRPRLVGLYSSFDAQHSWDSRVAGSGREHR